jgi:hypothetical protein
MQHSFKFGHNVNVALGILYIVSVLAFLGFVDLTRFPEIPAISAYALGLVSSQLLVVYYVYLKRRKTPEEN